MKDAAWLTTIVKEVVLRQPGIEDLGSMYDDTEPETGLCVKDGVWVRVEGREYLVSVSETSESITQREACDVRPE